MKNNGKTSKQRAAIKGKPGCIAGEIPHQPYRVFDNPFYSLVITMASILIAEAVVIFIMSNIPSLSPAKDAVINGLLLMLIIFPILHLFLLRPMRLHIQERKKVEAKLQSLSLTDELTGILNRRGFFTLADHQLKLAKRQKQEILLLYADVDNLKKINDTRGHKEGDSALSEVANVLKVTYRDSDIIARIGGDEFAVLPVGTSKDKISIITARLQNNLDSYNAKSERIYKLSLSVGVAAYNPEFIYSIDELLSEADKLMYERKRGKKDFEISEFIQDARFTAN